MASVLERWFSVIPSAPHRSTTIGAVYLSDGSRSSPAGLLDHRRVELVYLSDGSRSSPASTGNVGLFPLRMTELLPRTDYCVVRLVLVPCPVEAAHDHQRINRYGLILMPGDGERMDTSTILAVLRAERDQIDSAIAALEALGDGASAVRSTPKAAQVKTTPTKGKRVLSAASRKKMAEAAKQRWAAKKAAEKKPAAKAPVAKKVAARKTATKTAKKRVVSPESRKKMAEAQQKRWAAKRKAAKAAAKKAVAAPVATATVKE